MGNLQSGFTKENLEANTPILTVNKLVEDKFIFIIFHFHCAHVTYVISKLKQIVVSFRD